MHYSVNTLPPTHTPQKSLFLWILLAFPAENQIIAKPNVDHLPSFLPSTLRRVPDLTFMMDEAGTVILSLLTR